MNNLAVNVRFRDELNRHRSFIADWAGVP